MTEQVATFADRGVLLPMTGPALAGVRVRATAGGSREYLLPNPSGGRGLYVLPWDALAGLAAPSLFDILLIRALGPPTPDLVRSHALAVAAGGAAGPAAEAAARAALAADARVLDASRAGLVARLVMAMEPPGSGPPLAADVPAGRERRAAWALAALGAAQGLPAMTIAARLNDLAILVAPLGLLPQTEAAPVVQGIAALRHLAAALRRGSTAAHLIERVEDAADLADQQWRAVGAAIKDIATLLGAWPERVAGLADLAARPGWCLDGWPRLPALHALVPGLGDTLLDTLSALAPTWPVEASAWAGRPLAAPGRAGSVPGSLRPLGPEPQWLAESTMAWSLRA
ncbi:hypothetical protein ACQW02_18465 [Humitalea sp. 24SJ18S-53]|uniref:hypothetical protein n=1 Tax=Humitalea sp. 24SJ18S-53 TaxID=3422307 RepID=UPI003D674FFE